ncbi:hypothetical protein BOX15_Mlig000757g3, partial [Macrostomum lignano]
KQLTFKMISSLVNLSVWGAQFGTQLWVTFVHGPSLFRALSSETFQEVQSIIFPRYFLSQSILSTALLGSYIQLRGSAQQHFSLTRLAQNNPGIMAVLCASTASAWLHQLYLGPLVSQALRRKDKTAFRRLHGLSMALNMGGIAASVVYLVHLAWHCRL